MSVRVYGWLFAIAGCAVLVAGCVVVISSTFGGNTCVPETLFGTALIPVGGTMLYYGWSEKMTIKYLGAEMEFWRRKAPTIDEAIAEITEEQLNALAFLDRPQHYNQWSYTSSIGHALGLGRDQTRPLLLALKLQGLIAEAIGSRGPIWSLTENGKIVLNRKSSS